MRVDKEKKSSIKGGNTQVLKDELKKELKVKIDELKVTGVDTLKYVQGQVNTLEQIINLL